MTLVPSHVFGANPKIRNNIIYLDYQTVIYSSGPHIVLFDELQKTQRFILINESGPITAMCANSVSKVLAIAIKGSDIDESGRKNGPYLVIYDLESLKKKKTLSISQDAAEFTSVVFSKDSKTVFALASDAGCTIYAWNIDKGKILATIKAASQVNPEINEISINPYGRSTQICVIGNGILRVYKFEDPNFKLLHQVKVSKNMICHAWVSKTRIVAGTDDSKLLVFESGEHILEIAYLVPGDSEEHTENKESKILSVESYSNGLVAGVSTGVTVFFEKTDDTYLYKKSKEFLLEDSEVSTIAINPTEKNALACLNNGQIYTLPIESDGKDDVVKADRFFSSFHYGSILGMDVASNKPLIITSGSDRSIRVWNYIENTLEVIKYFPDEAISISLHPSGLYILAAFTNSIKLMTLLIDDIRPFWESNIPACKECSFSNGGQFFAVVLGSTVQVYNTWSFRIAGACKGSKAKLKSIMWSKDDKKMLSIDIEGSLTVWNMQTFKNEQVSAIENISFNSVSFGNNSKSFLALANDSTVKEVLDGQIIHTVSPKEPITNFVASNGSHHLFGATSGGTVFPIKSLSVDVTDPVTYTWHQGPVTQIRISPDDQYLFSAGEDGLLWIFKNTSSALKKTKEWLFTDEILVTKSDLKESYKIMSGLRGKIEDLKALNDSQQRMRDIAYQKKTSDAIYRYNVEIKALKEAGEDLVKERNTNTENHKRKMQKAREEHEARMTELRTSFEDKINVEKQKFEALKARQKSLAESAAKQTREIEQLHEYKVSELSEFCKNKLLEKDEQMEQTRYNMKVNEEVFKSGIKDIDEDIDQEYVSIQHHFEMKLKQEQDVFYKIKEENQKMRTEYDSLAGLIENNKEEIVKMNLEEKKLRQIIKSLEVDIIGLKKEIQEREDTMLEKDKRIFDLRKKNQELEKFKFVLDYKIVELRKQIEPKEKDIVALSTQIEEISSEIKDYGAKEIILRNSLDDFRMKDRAVTAEKAVFVRKKETFQNLLKEIMRDVATVWKTKDELNAVKRLIVSLFHKYSEINLDKSAIISSCGSQKINLGKNHKDPMEKHTLSRIALERTIKVIESQKFKARKSRFKEAIRFTSENSILKGEYNYLTTNLQKTNRKINQLKSVLNGDPVQNSTSSLNEVFVKQNSPKKQFPQHPLDRELADLNDPFPQAPSENPTTELEAMIDKESSNKLNLQQAD